MRQGLLVPGGRERSRKVSEYLVIFCVDDIDKMQDVR
jgi:hypothetical protein